MDMDRLYKLTKAKTSRLKKFLMPLFLVLMIFTIVSNTCEKEDPYTYNPNLRLLSGDTLRWSDHSTCPVVSPNGEKVYFLSLPWDEWHGNYYYTGLEVGRLYEIRSDGTGKRKLIDDIFSALAISPDGKKLAADLLSACTTYINPKYDTNAIVLIDIKTLLIDTLWVSHPNIAHIEFGKESENILYFSSFDPHNPEKYKIVKLNLSDTTEQVVGQGLGFDVFKDGRLYIDSKLYYLQIHPDSEDLAISIDDAHAHPPICEGGDIFWLLHINSRKIDTLPESFVPYFGAIVCSPYWFPCGDKIVFSASEAWGGLSDGDPYELWILENFFEQLEE